MNLPDLRKRLGEKVLLDARREPQFLVEPMHVKIQRFVTTAEDVEFVFEFIDLALELVQVRIKLGGVEQMLGNFGLRIHELPDVRENRV